MNKLFAILTSLLFLLLVIFPKQIFASTNYGDGNYGAANYNSGDTINSESPSCTDKTPSGTSPWLFEANPDGNTSLVVRFINWQTPVDHFAIEYGTSSNKYMFGVSSFGNKDTNSYTIKALSPNTTYYFRVRSGNGCATGDWSNELSAKTLTPISFNNLRITKSTSTPVNTNSSSDCRLYNIKPGDTLWKIAIEILGDGNKYTKIAEDNSDTYPSLKTSDNLKLGWTLKINCKSEDGKTSGANTPKEGYKVNIMVRDAKGSAVKNATVTLHSTPQTVKTNDNGIATFTNVEAGNHTVQISYNNYQGEQSINLTGNTKEFNINVTVQQKMLSLSPLATLIIVSLLLVIAFLAAKLYKKSKKNK